MLVLVEFASPTDPGAQPRILIAYYTREGYWCSMHGRIKGRVTHFRPLPAPPVTMASTSTQTTYPDHIVSTQNLVEATEQSHEDNFLPPHLFHDLGQPTIHTLDLAARRQADQATQLYIDKFEQARWETPGSILKSKQCVLLSLDINLYIQQKVRDAVYAHIIQVENTTEVPVEVAALAQARTARTQQGLAWLDKLEHDEPIVIDEET